MRNVAFVAFLNESKHLEEKKEGRPVVQALRFDK
jgi:hypothetical protein